MGDSHSGNSRESFFDGVNSSFGVFVGKSGVLFFVGFHVLNEVHEVNGLLEFLEVLSVDDVAELILNFNH